MAPKMIASLILKTIALVVIMMVLYGVGGQVMTAWGSQPAVAPEAQAADAGAIAEQKNPQAFRPLTPAEEQQAGKALVIVCLVNTLVLVYVVRRSRWGGLKTAAATFLFFFGSAWLILQIETLVFVRTITPMMVVRLLLMGLIISTPFSLAAAAILGKFRSKPEEATAPLQVAHLLPRLAALGALYVVVYFVFGYYVAWQSPDVRAYYSGVDPGSFLRQIQSGWNMAWWLFPLQFVRGIFWALVALPVVRMMKGAWWHAGLGVALGFSVLATSQLLFPNSFMPETVRMVHLVEVFSSNFLFGWMTAFLLSRTAPAAQLRTATA